jgi:hypothetical protein
MRWESWLSAAVLPDPRPPQTSTLPFRLSVFSPLSRSLSIDTIFLEEIVGRDA